MTETVTPKVIILIRADDPERKPLLYACSTCGHVNSPLIYACKDERAHEAARQAAEDCYTCKPNNICACGAECPKYWTSCGSCRYQKALDEAEEIADDGGPYCTFDGDKYFTDLEEAADDGCQWVSPCIITYPTIDAESVIDNVLSEMHEDADVDDLVGVDALFDAVKTFNDAQTTQSWLGDNKRKIRVPKASPACDTCGGSGELFEHSSGCNNDFCALAGGIDDCDGQVATCHCAGQEATEPDLKPVQLCGLTWKKALKSLGAVDCALRRPHWCSPVVILKDGLPVIDDDGEIKPFDFLPGDKTAKDWAMVPRVDDDGNEVPLTYRTSLPTPAREGAGA